MSSPPALRLALLFWLSCGTDSAAGTPALPSAGCPHDGGHDMPPFAAAGMLNFLSRGAGR
jgi:hypothetical protein